MAGDGKTIALARQEGAIAQTHYGPEARSLEVLGSCFNSRSRCSWRWPKPGWLLWTWPFSFSRSSNASGATIPVLWKKWHCGSVPTAPTKEDTRLMVPGEGLEPLRTRGF